MDKTIIKTAITETKIILDELVAEGLLDGDNAKIILSNFTVQQINKEITKDLTPTE